LIRKKRKIRKSSTDLAMMAAWRWPGDCAQVGDGVVPGGPEMQEERIGSSSERRFEDIPRRYIGPDQAEKKAGGNKRPDNR